MADGTIGYLENDTENKKIFISVSKALNPGGKHFLDIMNGSYADGHFPCRMWEAGEKCLTLSEFEWDSKTRVLLYGQRDFEYGGKVMNELRARVISQEKGIYKISNNTEVKAATVSGKYRYDVKTVSKNDRLRSL